MAIPSKVKGVYALRPSKSTPKHLLRRAWGAIDQIICYSSVGKSEK